MSLKQEIKDRIKEDLLQEELNKLSKLIKNEIRNQIEISLNDKKFKAAIKKEIQLSLLANFHDNSFSSYIPDREYDKICLRAIKSVLK